MSHAFVGEVRLLAGKSVPEGWALCDGQLLPISEFRELFELLGTAYGGNGTTTFALPDLRGRVAMHAGFGPGLLPRRRGEVGQGPAAVSLNASSVPTIPFVCMQYVIYLG